MAPAPRLLLIATAALLGATPLAAQRITSPYRFLDSREYFSVFAGPISTQPGGLGLGPQSGRIYGARLGYRAASGPLGLELTLATTPLKRTVRDTLRVGRDSAFAVFGPANQGLFLSTLDVRFNLTGARTWYALQPYVVLGGGVVFGTSGQNGADAKVPQPSRFQFGTSLAVDAGGGIEWFATRHFGVRADGRAVLWRVRAPAAFRVQNPLLPSGVWVRNLSLTGSLAYHF